MLQGHEKFSFSQRSIKAWNSLSEDVLSGRKSWAIVDV